jgi:two-component system, chemotaxis family, CheB/CheR fusion protein
VTDLEPDLHLEALLQLLKRERGFDFTGYKRASLERRMRRRMNELGLTSFEELQDHLVVNPDEFTSLFNTILINVTAFFRDPEAWAYLSEALLPDLLSRRDGQPIRAWCAGCASGEEAYTLAIVLAEALGMEEFRSRVKIYATDVDDEALTIARHASYTDREVATVPEGLREKYFERHGQRFVVAKDLRRAVIFGRNDLVLDAPISHVDLVTCRNTLMYFNADTQAQILQRFHFALRPDGYLFLGRAEMLLSHGALFRAVEIRRRFFTKVVPERRTTRAAPLVPSALEEPPSGQLSRLRQAALLSSPAAQVVVDRHGRLAVFTSRAANLFGLGPRDVGRLLQDLEVSYRPVDLRSPIEEAVSDRRQVWLRDVTWNRGTADPLTFDVQVAPLHDEDGDYLGTSVVFNDVTHHRQLQEELAYANRQLETAYEELQSTNEELETTNEELQSTVEELETTNEELQSTNEELETMNEELQSMNDELHLTGEAQREQQLLYSQMNEYMTAVLASLTVGVAVVDPDLRILTWNARAADLWGVREDEVTGRSLDDLDIGLPVSELRAPAFRQLSDGGGAPDVLHLEAVNRRGRPVEVRVTVSRLATDTGATRAALVVMDVLGQG